MMFTDDIVLCSETGKDVEIQFDKRCTALERRGMDKCQTETEYFALNGDQNDRIYLGGVEIPKVNDLKYLRFTIHENRNCDPEM